MIYDIDWTKRRGGIYARESKATSKRAAGYTTRSCPEQIDLSQDWCNRTGLPVLSVRQDGIGASGTSKGIREDWEDVVRDLESGAIDVLVCFEVSRMSRDSEVWAPVLAMARRQGAIFVVDGRPFDLTDDDDEFMLKLSFLFAERETRQTAKRVKRAIDANGVAGKPHGRLKYGYMRRYDPTTGEFREQLPHPHQARVVKRIFDDLKAGHGPVACAAGLNRDGVPPPDPDKSKGADRWTPTTVYNIATCKTYIGIRVHHGVETKGIWPGIVDEGDFWAVQRVLDSRRLGGARAARREYLLSGAMGCLVCKYRVRSSTRKTGRYYTCPLGHYAIKASEAEEWVTEVILAHLSNPGNFDRVSARDDRAMAEARTDLEKAMAERAELEALVSKGGIRPALAAQMDDALQARIDAAKRQLDAVSLPPVLRGVVGPGARDLWAAMHISQRRLIVLATLEIKVRGAGAGNVVPAEERLVITPRFA